MIPPLRWRDLLPGAPGATLAYFAKPIGWVALALAVGFFGGWCGHTPEKVVEWRTRADALTNRDALTVFHGRQTAGADSSAREVSHAHAIAARLRQPATPPTVPPQFNTDSVASAAYTVGYATGYKVAADSALVMHAADSTAYARIDVLRLAAVHRADSLSDLVKVAPLATRPPRLTCGVGLAYTAPIDGAAGLHPALTLGCHIPLLRF